MREKEITRHSSEANMSVRPATRLSKNRRPDAKNGTESAGYSTNNGVAPHTEALFSPKTSSARSDNIARAASRERLRTTITIAVMVLYVVFLGTVFYLSTTTPLAGFTATRNASQQWVVTHLTPASTAYEMGVKPGSIVKAVDGVSANQLPSIGEQDFAGANSIQIQQDGALIDVTLPQNSDNPIQRWIYAILGLIFIGVGSPVFVKARQRRASITFYVFCIATALCFASAIGSVSYAGWTLVATFFSLVFFACSFALFFFEFPAPVGKTVKQHSLFIFLTVATGAALIANYIWAILFDAYHYEILRPVIFMYLVGCVLAGVACILKTFITERSQEVRQQLTILLVGTAIAVAPACFLSLIPSLLGMPNVGVETSAIALGIMPLAFAYAITQHQLLGVRHFVRRGVVYLIMGSSVLFVFSLSASALGNLMPQGWEKSEVGLIGFGFFVFLIALFYSRLQVRVEHLVDKFIYHDAYDYKEALLQFSSQLASEQKLQVLADQLVERTCRLMNLSCGVLLLVVDPNDYDRHPTAPTHGHSGLPTVVLDDLDEENQEEYAQTTAPARLIAQTDGVRPVYLETYTAYGEAAHKLVEGLHNELSQLGVNLHSPDVTLHSIEMDQEDDGNRESGIGNQESLTPDSRFLTPNPRSFLGVPLWTRQRFVGVLCLAGKKTGERFTQDDLSLLSTLGSQAALAIYNAQLHEAREQALLDTIAALAHAIEAKDGYTIHHCENMTGRAMALAQSIGLSRSEVEWVRMGAILHDIGKIGIPDAVLNKPGKLTADEYEVIKEHAAIGARIVQSVSALQDVVPIVLHHQERYDGSGYPDKLAGEDIPIGARIIGVVDTYGAMTEDRIYRKAPGHAKAVEELQRLAGKQFDPVIVSAYVRLLEERPELAEPETESPQLEAAIA